MRSSEEPFKSKEVCWRCLTEWWRRLGGILQADGLRVMSRWCREPGRAQPPVGCIPRSGANPSRRSVHDGPAASSRASRAKCGARRFWSTRSPNEVGGSRHTAADATGGSVVLRPDSPSPPGSSLPSLRLEYPWHRALGNPFRRLLFRARSLGNQFCRRLFRARTLGDVFCRRLFRARSLGNELCRWFFRERRLGIGSGRRVKAGWRRWGRIGARL